MAWCGVGVWYGVVPLVAPGADDAAGWAPLGTTAVDSSHHFRLKPDMTYCYAESAVSLLLVALALAFDVIMRSFAFRPAPLRAAAAALLLSVPPLLSPLAALFPRCVPAPPLMVPHPRPKPCRPTARHSYYAVSRLIADVACCRRFAM